VLYFNTLGQPIVVLNSVKAAVDLLDKQGSNYSDRPRFVLLELYASLKPLSHMNLEYKLSDI
jgi:hypothetical protein